MMARVSHMGMEIALTHVMCVELFSSDFMSLLKLGLVLFDLLNNGA